MTSKVLTVGIDEAGYGPLLGPLTVACYASPHAIHGNIADSKMIYQKGKLNQLVSHCNKYVSEFSGFPKPERVSITQNEPWFNSYKLLYNRNLDPKAHISCSFIHVCEFNKKVTTGENKAEILIGQIKSSMKHVLKNISKYQKVIFLIDRLGGRKMYEPVLKSWGFEVLSKLEIKEKSEYQALYQKVPCEISFLVKGDQKYHHIAAASCFAKLMREYSMKDFNNWWLRKVPELKPTAGYFQDGKRFMKGIETYCIKHNISASNLERKL